MQIQQPLNGNLVVGNEVFAISRSRDFTDFQTLTPRDTQFRAVQALKDVCATFGERRSAISDLYRQRLNQMRTHLRMA